MDAGWDNDLLRIEIGDLKSQGFDLSLTGFDLGEIGEFLAPAKNSGVGDADEVPEVPEVPTTQLGDVWLLGASWICEDCGATMGYADGLAAGGECACGKA